MNKKVLGLHCEIKSWYKTYMIAIFNKSLNKATKNTVNLLN